MTEICQHPGCETKLSDSNLIGACNKHQHLYRGPRANWRMYTREELVLLGRLPERSVFAQIDDMATYNAKCAAQVIPD